ncbi:MAG: dicarboxylate/amino acid:cation symporter [Acidobacteriota bacterium]
MKKLELYQKIFIGLILGLILGIVWGRAAIAIEPVGKLFIRLITMVVIPLVFASIFVGTASLGDVKKLGRIGVKTLIYYLLTTAVAICIGLLLVNTLKPGYGLEKSAQEKLLKNYSGEQQINLGEIKKLSPVDFILNIVPTNPIKASMEGNMLQIIFLALIFGIAVSAMEQRKSQPLIDFFDGLSDSIIKIVHMIMKLAPYGVLALIGAVIGRFGTGIIMTLLKYCAVVATGLLIHTFIVFPFNLWVLGKENPWRFFKGMKDAMLMAFSTCSSSATLPVTMENCERLGVPRFIYSFVLPLGATINMNGTALYQGVSAVFIAQVYGIPLTLPDQLTIVLTATAAAIGTAGVPGVGMIMLTMVLRAVNVPLEGIALVLGVDRFLDMLRTVPNVLGDATCAVIMANIEKRREAISDTLIRK